MRSGKKILSLSTRREFVRNFSEIQVAKNPLVATATSFRKFNEFNDIVTSRHTFFDESTRRCYSFTSLVKSPQDENEITNEREIDSSTPDEDFDSATAFDDEIMDGDQSGKDRIWMDPQAPLEERVNRFINLPLGEIHHLDIKLTSLELIKACGKQNSFEGMKNAQDILDRLIEEKKYVNNSQETTTTAFIVIPDRPFKMVMYGWANMCRKVDLAPQRMREVLDLMIQEAEYDKKISEQVNSSRIEEQSYSNDDSNNDGNDGGSDDDTQHDDLFIGLSCEPTVDIYNTLLQGLTQAATRSIQAAIEAEHALSKMDKMNRTRGWHTKPNTRSYSLVMNAYTKTRHATAGHRAESVLRRMIERHEYEKQEYFEEYGLEYNIVDPEQNNKIIVTPDTVAYTTVIQAHGDSDSSESAEKAFMLLNELIHSDNPALVPDSFAFATTINAFSKMADRKKSPKDRVEAAQRAEDILWMMVDIMKNNQEHSNDHLSGSIVPFNACLNAWAQSFTPESPHRAEDLLHRMLDPDLQSIIQVQPNTVSFNTCMQAWSKACKFEDSAAPEKAEELLTLLINLSNDAVDSPDGDKDWKLRPDTRSYVTVMNAYALSRKEDSVVQTRRLLSELIREGRGKYFDCGGKDKMNAYPFTIILKAAANAKTNDSGSDEAEENAFGSLDVEDDGIPVEDPYTIALETYNELLNDTYDLGVRADHFAFSEMLAVVAKYTAAESIERRQRIEEVFQDACNAGQVSSVVIRAMQKACPNDIVLADLLRLRGNSTVASIESINIFPKQWTSRVPQEFRRVSSRNDHFRKQSKFFRGKKSNSEEKQYGKKGSYRTKPNNASYDKSKTRRRNNTN
jgi:hypothetical protein